MDTCRVYHYVYRITNKVTNKHYYGKRSSKKVKPVDDLGKRYFSSSTDKSFIQDQKDNPQNYKYKIVSLYSTAAEAVSKEIKLHHKFNVGVNPRFYNKVKQTAAGFDTTGSKMTEEQLEKHRKRNLGRKHTEEAKLKCAAAKVGNSWNKGRKHDPSSIEKMKQNTKKGLSSPLSVAVNIYNYATNALVAKEVCLSEWCGSDKSLRSNLAATLRCDRSLPSTKYNPHQAKGLYAKHVNA